MSNKHHEDLRCPKCLKAFESRQGLKAHMKVKRHTVARIHAPEESRARAALQTEHQRRLEAARAGQ